MNSRLSLTGLSIVMAASVVSMSWAQENVVPDAQTFRTTALLQLVYQGTNKVGVLQIDRGYIWGHDLVNLALGTSLSTPRTNQVLAMDIADDSSSMNLVVYDKVLSNNIATIATSTGIDSVLGDVATNKFFNERFVAKMQFASINALAGGAMAVAGRIHLNPSNGIPQSVSYDTDTALDSRYCDLVVADEDDKDRNVSIAGEAHFVGELNIITDGGANTNAFLIPIGHMTIRHTLAMAPVTP
jgi:hypothetical protein